MGLWGQGSGTRRSLLPQIEPFLRAPQRRARAASAKDWPSDRFRPSPRIASTESAPSELCPARPDKPHLYDAYARLRQSIVYDNGIASNNLLERLPLPDRNKATPGHQGRFLHNRGNRHEPVSRHDHLRRHSRRRQSEFHHRRQARSGIDAGLHAPGENGPLQPRAGPRARGPRQGGRGLRRLHGHRRHQPLYPRQAVLKGRQPVQDLRALLDRRGGAGVRRHRPRPARLRGEVLHGGRQMGHGGQQHPYLLHPRPAQVLRLHPQPEAPAAERPA
jgi:hypothetical protein